MRLRWGTAIWGAIAALAVTAVTADPRGEQAARRVESSAQRPKDRIFPEVSERQRRAATLEFVGPKGPVIRLVPGAQGGHELFVDEEIWGPASEEAVQNAWSNLRMARVIREVDASTGSEVGRWGAITLHIGDRSLTLRLGKKAGDGAGVYAQRQSQPNVEVVDGELTALVESPAELWLRRSMLAVEVPQVTRVQWAGAPELSRGADGRWRVQLDPEDERLLSSAAVDLRLARLLHAPLRKRVVRVPAAVQSLRAWLTVVDAQGISHHVMAGAACPGEPHLRLVDRGPGLLGCIDAQMLDLWDFTDEEGVGLVEQKLVPHRFGEWSGVEQREPQALSLRRRPGRWEMALSEQGDRFSVVSESEVYRWYRRLGDISLLPGGAPLTQSQIQAFTPSFRAQLLFDAGQRMELTCGPIQGERMACRRDRGPLYRVSPARVGELALSFDALADRQILEYSVGSVRGVEMIDGTGPSRLRQAAYLDYGEWRLSAPDHPDADGALDQVRLEAFLSTLSDLRAIAWLPDSKQRPQRVIELDFVPGLQAKQGNKIELFSDCAARVVSGDRPGRLARLGSSTCQTLFGSILYADPVASVLRNATRIEVELYGPKRQIRRRSVVATQGPGEGFAAPDLSSQAQARLLARLERWSQRRALGLRSGEPIASPRVARLHLQRHQAPPMTLDIGEDWVHIHGRDWWIQTDRPVQGGKR